MTENKYVSVFSSELKPLVSEEKDKYLAFSSLVNLIDFIPNIDTAKNNDLLPVAFNAFVANRVNKNGDVINTETALSVYKNFINKPINIEHNRSRVVGVILTAGFSEFGTDVTLTEEDVKNLKTPFNVTLGGVIWKVVSDELSDVIEDSADPTSENYRKISASWELGFRDYQLVVLDESEKNIENAELITDKDKIAELEVNLRAFGGSGKLENGKYIYRQIISEVSPLGIGLTTTPAADVSGILTENKALEDYSSLNEKNDVLTNIRDMKIETLKDINDESMKELAASSVTDFIQSELEKASEQYKLEAAKAEETLKSVKEKAETLEKEYASVCEKMSLIANELSEIKKVQAEKEAEDLFNKRMSLMDEDYNLSDEDRQILSSEIKSMDEEAFSAFQKKMEVLLKEKNKSVIASKEKEKQESLPPQQSLSSQESKEEALEIIDDALHNAKISANEVPVSSEPEQSLFSKYANAFSYDQFDFSVKRKN